MKVEEEHGEAKGRRINKIINNNNERKKKNVASEK